MSETQNNTVVAAFFTATGNAGLTKNQRVEIGGSSADNDFGKFLKAATGVNDSKERYYQAEKPDHREPGRNSTGLERSAKTNHDMGRPKPKIKDDDGVQHNKKPMETKERATTQAVETKSVRPGENQAENEIQASKDNQLPEEISAEMIPLLNQLAQLLALLNPQEAETTGAIGSNGLNGVDAANLQALLEQLQLLVDSQTKTAPSLTPNGIGTAASSVAGTANQAAIDLLNQITAGLQSNSLTDAPNFNQLMGELAASLKNLSAKEPKSQISETGKGAALQPGSGQISAQENPGVSFASAILEMGQAEAGEEAVANPSQPELQAQSQNSAAQLAKGAFSEGKPLNLAVIQTQLAVGGSQDQTGSNVAVAPLQNQNGPMVDQIQQPANQEAAPVNRELFSQIVERAKIMVSQNHSEMEVSLKPDHLGKLQLKVAVENQVVTAKFIAESQQVKQIIETNLNQLRDQLRENGMQIDVLTVSVGGQMDAQNFTQTGNDQSGANQFGGRPKGYHEFNESNEELNAPSPQTVRETVIDLIA